MKKLLILTMVLSALLVGMSTVAMADIYYLSPGDDIQAVINTASPDDTIEFALGTYALTTTLNVNKSLTLTSEDPYAATKPVIDGGGTLGTIIYIAADDVTLDGLEITNGTGDLVKSDLPAVARVTVRNCIVHASSGDDGVQLKNCTDCLIECCVAYDVAQDGFNMAYSSGGTIRNCEVYNSNSENAAIYVYYSAAMTVECNYIHDNTASNGIMIYKMGDWGASYVSNNLIVNNTFVGRKYAQDGNAIQLYVPFDEVNVDAELYVLHNTVDNNTGTGKYGATAGQGIYWGQKYVDGAPVYLLDNIISSNGGWGIKTELLGSVNPNGEINYNDIWNNTLGDISNAFSGVTVGLNNISTNPVYNPDYTLQSGSPCIGAASDGKDMGVLFNECGCPPPVIEVIIDIKPGSYPNSINLKSKGVVPVAVLTTGGFDASTVDPSTVLFAGAEPVRWRMKDVDSDGDLDLLFHFKTQELNLDENSIEATLIGNLYDGAPIQGTDTVNIVPKGK